MLTVTITVHAPNLQDAMKAVRSLWVRRWADDLTFQPGPKASPGTAYLMHMTIDPPTPKATP